MPFESGPVLVRHPAILFTTTLFPLTRLSCVHHACVCRAQRGNAAGSGGGLAGCVLLVRAWRSLVALVSTFWCDPEPRLPHSLVVWTVSDSPAVCYLQPFVLLSPPRASTKPCPHFPHITHSLLTTPPSPTDSRLFYRTNLNYTRARSLFPFARLRTRASIRTLPTTGQAELEQNPYIPTRVPQPELSPLPYCTGSRLQHLFGASVYAVWSCRYRLSFCNSAWPNAPVWK